MTLPPLPVDRPVLACYGDDFTGSGAVMEVLTFAGLPRCSSSNRRRPRASPASPAPAPSASPATPAPAPRLDARRAAGGLRGLRALGAPILHYKVCSTLDSAPHMGSIGAAAEIGLADGGIAPLVVAAPGSAAGRPSAPSSPAPATASTA